MITTFLSSSRGGDPLDALCAKAKALGAEAVGLRLSSGHPVAVESAERECRETRQTFADAGLPVAVAVLPFDEHAHLGCRDADAHRRSVRRLTDALQRAAWLGAQTLVATPATLAAPGEQGSVTCTYEQALNGTYAALQELRFVGDKLGVQLALVAGTNRFLLSPVELRELIDEQHSPAIGTCIDLHAPGSAGWTDGWIRTLRSRVHCVTMVGEEHAESVPMPPSLHPVIDALRSVGYEGPICVGSESEASALSQAIEAFGPA